MLWTEKAWADDPPQPIWDPVLSQAPVFGTLYHRPGVTANPKMLPLIDEFLPY